MKENFKIALYILLVMVVIAEFGVISPSPSQFIPSWMFKLIIIVGGFFAIMDRWVYPFRDLCKDFMKLIRG
jgi:hypothetical protein